MEEVHNIAMTYYRKLTQEQREEVYKCFLNMDGNGDGKIVVSEFLDSLQIEESSRSWYNMLFQDLDTDGNGSLDFNEFITFHSFKFRTTITCGGCGVILNGNLYFTCVHCFGRVGPSFDLCRSCFSRNNFTHSHENGVAPVFRDTSSLLLHMRKENLAREVAIVNNANTNSNAAVNSAKEVLAAGNTAINAAIDAIADVIGFMARSGCTIM